MKPNTIFWMGEAGLGLILMIILLTFLLGWYWLFPALLLVYVFSLGSFAIALEKRLFELMEASCKN